MNISIKLLSCASGLLLSLHSTALSEIPHAPGKTPIVVLQGEVTIDGQQRPDLGRSFSDTLTGGFLKAKAYSVLDHLSSQPIAQAVENNPQLAPELSAVSVGEAIGARWIYVPRMVVEGDFHKLTMKKIRVSDGEVVDVFETHANGDRSTMFLLVGDALKDIYAQAQAAKKSVHLEPIPTGESVPLIEPDALDPAPPLPPGSYPPAPAAETAPEPADAQTVTDTAAPADAPTTPEEEPAAPAAPETKPVPAGLKLVDGTYVRDDADLASSRPDTATITKEETKIEDPATETEDRFARYMGTVTSVNSEWRFCVLRVRGGESLHIGDRLAVKTGAIVPNDTVLKVTKIEGRQAVADLGKSVDLASIEAGQKIYQWTAK